VRCGGPEEIDYLVYFSTGSVFVKYERGYSPEALEKARCTGPYLSYDYVLLSEMDFPERPLMNINWS